MKRINAQHGFTLIELLVVISIVALMISILLPALGNARDSARDISCTSQLRQASLGAAAYAADNNDFAPWFGNVESSANTSNVLELLPIGHDRLYGTDLQRSDVTENFGKMHMGLTMVETGYWQPTALRCPTRPGGAVAGSKTWDTSLYNPNAHPVTPEGSTVVSSSYFINVYGDRNSSAVESDSPYFTTREGTDGARWAWRMSDSKSSSVLMWDLYRDRDPSGSIWIAKNDHNNLLVRSFLDGSAGTEPYRSPRSLIQNATSDMTRQIVDVTPGTNGLTRENEVRPWQN